MKTLNGWVAVTPFPETNIKTTHKRGIALIDQTTKLTELTVLHEAFNTDGTPLFAPGNKVYVKGDAMKHQWSGEVYDSADGAKYILIPYSIIVAASEK